MSIDSLKQHSNMSIILLYLHIILDVFFTKYRISAHYLRIQSARSGRNAVPRNKRYCNCCNTFDIEDLYHFVIVCPHFADLRKLTLKSITMKDHLFSILLQTHDEKQLRNTVLYLKQKNQDLN